MAELEKVIKGLEICIRVQDNEKCPDECPYRKDICYGTVGLMADALSLLKAQEADKSKYRLRNIALRVELRWIWRNKMISAWWLLLIIPACVTLGLWFAALMAAGRGD